MKKILFSLIFVLFIYTLRGQNQFQNGIFSINGNTYNCPIHNDYVVIKNQQNVLNHLQDYYTIQSLECLNTNLYNLGSSGGLSFVKTKIQSQFTPARVAELKLYGQTGFALSFFLDKNGVVKEMYFTIRKDTKLTPQEIYNMEMILKNVQIPFNMGDCPTTGTGYFLFSINVGFGSD